MVLKGWKDEKNSAPVCLRDSVCCIEWLWPGDF